MRKLRSEAIKHGDQYYKTGSLCVRGHLSKRLTLDGSCIQCRYEYQKKARDRIKKIRADKEDRR